MNNKVLFGGLLLVIIAFLMVGCQGLPERPIEIIDLTKNMNLHIKKKFAEEFISLTADEIIALGKMGDTKKNTDNEPEGINNYISLSISDNCNYDEKGNLKKNDGYCGVVKRNGVCIDIKCLEALGEDLDEGCANGDCDFTILMEKWKLIAYIDPFILKTKNIQFKNIPKRESIQKVTISNSDNKEIILRMSKNNIFGISENMNITNIDKNSTIKAYLMENGHHYVINLVQQNN